MRVLVVGASGMLGSAVVSELQARHEVLQASRTGQIPVDLKDPDSIGKMYDTAGSVDAVVCTAGVTPFKPVSELSREDFQAGLDDKLLGQIELVRQGMSRVSEGGSFTLVSGVTAYDPIATGAVAGTVNGALDAFVRCTAIGLPRGQRINAVSAQVFEEACDAYAEFFPGAIPVPVAEVARAFAKSVEGAQTGQVYRVGW